jgi:alcohol dehydrogenase (cytochrome c)
LAEHLFTSVWILDNRVDVSLDFVNEFDPKPCAFLFASNVEGPPQSHGTGAILAVDPATAGIKWRFDLVSTPSAGMLATAGGLVFTGDRQGYVIALDDRTGKVLWKFQTGGAVAAPPITYSLEGKQYLEIAAGGSILTFTVK